jgi:type II secretory pathway pseudopilin PulG
MIRRLQAGMSYVETVVWIAIFTSATIALGSSLVYFYHTAHYSIEQSSAVASVQHAMDTMVRTIREANYGSDGSYPIISLATSSIAFYAQVNEQSPYVQKVRFFVSSSSLMQGVTNASGDPPTYSGTEVVTRIADYVQNPRLATTTFSYFDANGTLMTDLTRIGSVRFVRANIIVDVNPNDQPTQLTLRSSTALRNLIDH